MLRWIIIVLVICTPLRAALAAAQYCPWMANSQSTESMQNTAAMGGMEGMGDISDSCPGMSTANGKCTFETACFATPLLPTVAAHMPAPLLPQMPAGQACAWRNFSPQASLRVPIHIL